jgi:glyoxylase-like metal-dependent hydrolase (beta-lactamase superfamily II)
MNDRAVAAIQYLTETPPPRGATPEIVPGLQWLRVPLPFRLNHVNVWLLDDGDGWTIVDTGANNADTKALWDDVLQNRKLNRLIGTHGHPDHIGLAGWLIERRPMALHMTLGEWLAPQIWREEGLKPMRPEVEAYYLSHAVPQSAIDRMKYEREKAPFRNYPLPPSFVRFRDGDEIRFGGRAWRVLVNGGHADEHASFFCEAERILIAGDQVLSKISPVVGVFPSQPLADPLADYLASLKRLASLPADTLVLPSHGLPFRGLHARLTELEVHHAQRLGKLLAGMTGAHSGVELARVLFEKAMGEGQTVLALAETLAHAHRLVTDGRVVRDVRADGAVTFRAVR